MGKESAPIRTIIGEKRTMRFVIAGELALVAATSLAITQCTGERPYIIESPATIESTGHAGFDKADMFSLVGLPEDD